MINKEFEVICIKDIEFEYHTFRKGQIYLVNEVKLDENYIVVKGTYGGSAFWIKNKHGKLSSFSEHFLTLAEWRANQIDKILND